MKHIIFPKKLKTGNHIRIIAPSLSLTIVSQEVQKIALTRLKELGFQISFGKHVNESDEFDSTTIQSRLEDLHDAFADKTVDGILTVLGGFNSNQLLKYIDWELIKNNPKILIGHSDITVLNNAIFAKTGVVTYLGPFYFSFGEKYNVDYTINYFKKCVWTDEPFEIKPSPTWSDDEWYIDQEKRNFIKNEGFLVINEGEAQGTILGGNITCFRLLQGTEYFPQIHDTILFLEDDFEAKPHHIDAHLQALIHTPEFSNVKGLVLGRFQKSCQMTNELLIKIIKTKQELAKIPVIANVDFGHTDPKATVPIGGTCQIVAGDQASITVLRH